MPMSRRKHYPGCYRYTIEDLDQFGQIKRYSSHMWIAEIRYSDTGSIRRYAGMWGTRHDAEDEVQNLLIREWNLQHGYHQTFQVVK